VPSWSRSCPRTITSRPTTTDGWTPGGSSGTSRAADPADVAAAGERWLAEARATNADELRHAEEAVEDLAARLRASVRRLHDLRGREQELGELRAVDFARDAAVLRDLPGVVDVAVTDEGVAIETGPITIERDGRTHAIGRFRVELSPSDGARVVLVEQPPGVGVAWIHPHVQGDLPCLGNARVGVEKLLGDLQLVPAAQVMLRFLETYDAETAYCDLSAWPVTTGPEPEGG
jgi:hypothetical protein